MIVAEAGGSKATLYKYFPTKEKLVEGLMEAVAERMNRDHADASLDSMPLRAALTKIGRATLEGVCSQTGIDLYRLSLAELDRFPELARTVWAHGPAVTYAAFIRFLERRRERNEIEFEDAQLTAEHFIAAIAGHIQNKVAMRICDPPGPREMTRRVASAVDLFVSRYATASARRSVPRTGR